MILAPTKPDVSVEPRDYQSHAIDAAFDAWANGKTGSLVRLPTGTGKTVVGSLCAARWLDMGDDRRVFVCSHERQLIWQFAEEIQDLIGIDPAIEMADRSIHRDDVASGYARVVVASRATLLDRNGYSRLEKFYPQLKWLLIIDEAHRWARKLTSCNPVVEWFERNPESKRLGLTATPVRGDGVSLSGLFDHIAADYRLYDTDGGACAVEDGWAVPYDQRYVIVEGVDFRGLKEVAGDFDDAQLEQILGAQEQLAKLIEPTMELVGDRRTLVFSPGVGMAYAVANYINGKAGRVIAKALDGSVPEDKRREVYKEFERDEIQWLSVCGLCVAKGTRILTDRGEVPIQDVTMDMRVWDGVEFVHHDGVICKGRRPVIEYAGLIATEDHDVWTDDGWKSLAACKESGLAVAVSGIGGRPVRESDNYYRTGRVGARTTACGKQVYDMWQTLDASVLRNSTNDRWMQVMQFETKQPEQTASTCVARNGVLQPIASHFWLGSQGVCSETSRLGSAVHGLWSMLREAIVGTDKWSIRMQKLFAKKRHTTMAAISMSGCYAAMHEPIIGGLPGLRRSRNTDELPECPSNGAMGDGQLGFTQISHLGQDRQQRPLRARKSSVCDEHDSGEQSKTETIEEVFDIVNAGPRHRYTANGLIVSNCREGFNSPGCQAVAIFRPTKSQALAEQMKGRGCRPLRGTITTGMTRDERLAAIASSAKPYCMIIDLVGITGLADTATTAHLMTEGMDDEAAESVVREVNRRVMAAQDTGEPVDPSKIMREVKLAKAERDELERQKKLAKLAPRVTYEAVKVPQGHTGPGAYQWRPEKRGARMLFGKHKGRTMGEIPTDYLDWVVTGSEARGWMREAAKAELEKRREAGDAPELATPKQLGWLRWQGIRPRDGLTKREASKIIGEMMESKEA